jgi:hypothetical protein
VGTVGEPGQENITKYDKIVSFDRWDVIIKCDDIDRVGLTNRSGRPPGDGDAEHEQRPVVGIAHLAG